ncbi:hypothetical protein [Brachybacterium sp. P6-10-X1]|uniref:hypothetical protein n=1 Tax=Brachybacterium sp. P6-10-X1 TaxID=1903186 RepID=UPI0012FC61CC|nr:hypothetical protein [Brachybacterium sp. P6-10-X1]
MIRTIGRGMLEVARAIDTGHAIKHGLTPRAYRNGGPTAPSAAPVANTVRPLEELDMQP